MTSVNLDQTIAPLDNDDEDENATINVFHSAANSPASVTYLINPAATMGEDKDNKHKKHKHKKDEEPNIFYQHMNTASHACALLFTTLIVYYCFSGEFVFFTWHPLLLSIGWMFLMSVAILTLSKDNLFTGTLRKKIRVRLHWIFLTIALVLILAGFTVVYINKNNLNKSHFKSWHGLFGFIGIVCSIPTCLDGILVNYHGELKRYFSPRWNKLLHFGSSVLTIVCGGMALILSVYTKWFARNSNENILAFVIGLVLALVPVVWTLYIPVTKCFNLVKGAFVKKDS